MQDYQEAMVKSLVAVAWADGRIHDDEAEVIEALLSAFEIQGEDAEHIREFAKTERTLEDVPLTELGVHDRRMLLQHAVILTFVDGEQSERELEVLDGLVGKLRIPEDEAKHIVEGATERAKRLVALL